MSKKKFIKISIALSTIALLSLAQVRIASANTQDDVYLGAECDWIGAVVGQKCTKGTKPTGTCQKDLNYDPAGIKLRCMAELYSNDNPIGKGCSKANKCGQMHIIFPGMITDTPTLSVPIDLICPIDGCTVPAEFVGLGSWCRNPVAECKDNSPALEYTCDTDDNRCIASVGGMPCTNDSAKVNKDTNIGVLGEDILLSQRCDIGLICDEEAGTCKNDFGQGAVPTDKLGETAEDIRDQIRNIINIALGFLGVAGVIVTIYGGALWMSAAGDDEKVGKAKKTIVSGLIGLVIIGIAWTIVSYVLKVTGDVA